MLKSELAIGHLVTHNPSGEERLRELVEGDMVPMTVLNPDFRVGMIIGHKGEGCDHWLVYRGDEVSCWYVTDELVRLS